MALHDSLRELVSVRGAGVVDEAEELRGALDDFLAEEEATLGELNLLVDAVRLGALRRVLDVMDHGAVPEAAIREAGATLARDRGTDDPTRSCWALATLCFALGRVDEPMVRMFRGDAGTMPAAAPPSAPHGPAPIPVLSGPGTAERPPTQVLQDHSSVPPPPPISQPAQPQSVQPQSVQPQPVHPQSVQPPSPTTEVHVPPPHQPYGAPLPPVVPERRSGRGGIFLLVVLVALIIGGLVAAGVILLSSDNDDDPAASGDGENASAGSSGGPKQKPAAGLSEDEALVPYTDDDGQSVIYRVNMIDGGYEPVTGGPYDGLPTLSPDRRTMTYDVGPTPLTLYRWDLKSAAYEPFFTDAGPCDHALRPGWSLDGGKVAVSCTGTDKTPDGLWLANPDGSGLELLLEDSLVRGSPTWVSPTRIVYGRQDDASETAPLTFWTLDINERVPEQLDVGLESTLQLTHIDWSEEAGKLLFLVSPPGEPEVGDVWTMDADGSNPSKVADGEFAHPVWSPDGRAIGVTSFDDAGVESLAYIPLDDPDNPVVVENPPPGDVGIPVWGTR